MLSAPAMVLALLALVQSLGFAQAMQEGLRRLDVYSFALGALCLGLTAWLAARVAEQLYGLAIWRRRRPLPAAWAGWLAGLLVLTNGALVRGILTGPEVGLFIVLLLAAYDALLVGRPRAVALFGSLAALARPEGLALMLGLGAIEAWRTWRRSDRTARPASPLLAAPPLCGALRALVSLYLAGPQQLAGAPARADLAGALREAWLPFLSGFAPEALRRLPQQWLPLPARPLLYMPPLLGALGLSYLLLTAVRDWRYPRGRASAILGLWVLVALGLAVTARRSESLLPCLALGLAAGAPALANVAGSRAFGEWARPLFLTLSALALLLSLSSLPGFWKASRPGATGASAQRAQQLPKAADYDKLNPSFL